jgi:excisionase family DNA binding protein
MLTPAATPAPDAPEERVLTRAEVARLFRVDPATVTRWTRTGKLPAFRTPGGTRRYYAAEVEKHLPANRQIP